MNSDGCDDPRDPSASPDANDSTAQPTPPMTDVPVTTKDACARIEADLAEADGETLVFRWGCAVHPMEWDGRRVLGLTTRGAERLLLSVDALRRFENAASFVRGRVCTALAPGPGTQSRLDWLDYEEPEASIVCEDLALSLMVTPTNRRRERPLWLPSIITPPALASEPLVLLLARRPAGLPG